MNWSIKSRCKLLSMNYCHIFPDNFPDQSILKESSPGISLEGMMLTLKLQYFGHLMRRVDSLENTPMLGGLGAGGEGDDRGWDGWMASWTRWMWVWVNTRSWWWTGKPGVLRLMGSQRVRHNWATELNWKCSLPGSSVHGIFRQEYWSGLPLPSPGDLPDSWINPGLMHCRQTLYRLSHQGSSKAYVRSC